MTADPYVVYCKPPGWGFFANFFLILDGISEADRQGWAPVVDLEHHRTHYNEPTAVGGTANAWEYYFEQPAGVSVAEALAAGAASNEGKPTGEFFWTPTGLDDPRMGGEVAARERSLVARHVRVLPEIGASVDDLLGTGSRPDLLGVHVRGTDARQSTLPKHPVPAPAQVYLERAVGLVEQRGFAGVFLACDEIETVELFRAELGDRLICAEAFRVPASTRTKPDFDWLFAHSRPHHRYLLGREVLVDVLALARCRTLLFGPSNIALAAVAFAAEDPEVVGVAPVTLSGRRYFRRKYFDPRHLWKAGSTQLDRRRGHRRPSAMSKGSAT